MTRRDQEMLECEIARLALENARLTAASAAGGAVREDVVAALHEKARLQAALRKLDREYDDLYLRACEGGSAIGAAQAVGRRIAIADVLKLLTPSAAG